MSKRPRAKRLGEIIERLKKAELDGIEKKKLIKQCHEEWGLSVRTIEGYISKMVLLLLRLMGIAVKNRLMTTNNESRSFSLDSLMPIN